MSIRVTLNCPIDPCKYKQLVIFLEENLPNVRSFKGCMRVSVLFDSDKTQMLLDEEWLSVESHQGYLNSIDKNGVLKSLQSFLRSAPEIKYFQLAQM